MNRSNGKDSAGSSVEIEISYGPDRQCMLAALRVVLGLPRVIPATDANDLLSSSS